MKKNFLFAVACMLLSSCSTPNFYQVYDVETVGLTEKGDLLVYENADCVVSYSLWGEGGNLSFVFQNKTNQNLYLIMPQCFLIHNGRALDYYDNNTYTYSITKGSSDVVSAQASLYGYTSHYDHWHPASVTRGAAIAASQSSTNSVSYKAPQTICIPANSAKVIDGFKLSNTVHLECDATKNNFPKRTSQFITYDETNTPLSVNNVIVYSNNPQGKNYHKIENKFWVKTFTNYSEKAALDSYKEHDCTTGKDIDKKAFKMSQPNRFYNIYNRNTSRGSVVIAK